MSKEFSYEKNTLIVFLSGEIDQHTTVEIKQKIDIELEQSLRKNIIFDLKDVVLMDSSGIGLIVGRYKLTKALGGTTVLCNAIGSVNKMIELSGIGKIVKNFKSLHEAEKALAIQNEGEELKQ